ncbi:hypothetical protein [Streptomyces sp. NPDC003717]|uniref:hypothetical protein n=1 Tax=Streptomyces sp. NPDC003717 TaxID=3154276 RepID=UPI0033B286FD
MRGRSFQPGRLVTGLVLAVAGFLYAGDAGGLWQIPWFTAIPLVVGGLCLAGLVAAMARGLRGRRRARDPRAGAGAGPDAPR